MGKNKKRRLDPVLREPIPPHLALPSRAALLEPSKLNGEYTVQFDEGTTITTTYKDNVRHGLETTINTFSKLRRTATYENGKLNGLSTVDDPAVHMSEWYVDGKKHGIQMAQFSSGHTMETPYRWGQKHGFAVHRLIGGSDDSDSTLRIVEYRNDVRIATKWIDGSLDEDRKTQGRREGFAKVSEAIEGADLNSGQYKKIYDAVQKLHEIV